MNSKIHYIASPNDVTIIRDGDCARIEYKEEGIPVTHLEIGPEIAGMSNGEILEAYNECLRNDAKLAAERKHVAFEVPLGAAQIEYQWVPRGGVLRCLIQDDEHGQLIVKIDEQALPLKQFGKLLATYAGWGMRARGRSAPTPSDRGAGTHAGRMSTVTGGTHGLSQARSESDPLYRDRQ